MKLTAAGALLGLLLGGVVAVVSHFSSRTVPEVFELSGVQNGNTVEQTLGTPLVHPSWWPVLPVALAVGLVAGAALGLVLHRLGITFVVRSKEERKLPDRVM